MTETKLQGDHFSSVISFPQEMEIDENRMSVLLPFADGNRRDGVGDVIEVDGINLERHRRSPVVLWEHGKAGISMPIALAEDPETKAYCVYLDGMARIAKGKAFFYQGDDEHGLFCRQLFHLIASKFIRGGSIGYQVIQANPLPPDYSGEGPPVQGQHLIKTMMLEFSVVTIPANGDTVMKSMEWTDWRERAREILCLPNLCGKSLAMPLRKTLEPYAAEGKVMSNGVETKAGRRDKQDRFTVIEGGDGKYTVYASAGGFGSEDKGKKEFSTYQEAEVYAHELATKWQVSSISDQTRNHKAMSANDTTRGGALVKPPQQGLKKDIPQDTEAPVAVPTGNLSETNVPPPTWKPGVGAEKMKKIRAKYKSSNDFSNRVHESLRANGPSSLVEVMKEARLGQWEADDALQELVRAGKVGKQTSQGRVVYYLLRQGKSFVKLDNGNIELYRDPDNGPTGNLSETNVPPPTWKPGVGAEKMKQIRMKWRGKSEDLDGNYERNRRAAEQGLREPPVDWSVNWDRQGRQSRGQWLRSVGIDHNPTIYDLIQLDARQLPSDVQQKLKRKFAGKSIAEEKSISVRYTRRVVKGYANIQMKFDTAGMNTDQQNAFVKEMKDCGFGHPSGGKWSGEGDEKKLDAPLKAANYSFDLEPGKNLAEAIGKATGIGERHGAKYMGNVKSIQGQTKGNGPNIISAIQARLSEPNGVVQITTHTRSTVYTNKHRDWFEVQGSSPMVRSGSKWVSIEFAQVRLGYEKSLTKSINIQTKAPIDHSPQKGDKVKLDGTERVGYVLQSGSNIVKVKWDDTGETSTELKSRVSKIKSGAQTMKTKSADQPTETEMPEESVETKQEGNRKEFHLQESLGSQVMRRWHEDHSKLMKDYDEILPVLDHPDVKAFVEENLKNWEKGLSAVEKNHKKWFKDVDPLEGAMDTEEKNIPEDETEEKDHLPSEIDNAEPADSDEPERPTADEAVEGMEKETEDETPEEKALRIKQTKSVRKKYRVKSADDIWSDEGKYEVHPKNGRWIVVNSETGQIREDLIFASKQEAIRSAQKLNAQGNKALPMDGTDAVPDDQDGMKWFKGLAEHHQGNVVEAKGYLKELSETQDEGFTQEHRMKAYMHGTHLEKTFEETDKVDEEANVENAEKSTKDMTEELNELNQHATWEGQPAIVKFSGGVWTLSLKDNASKSKYVSKQEIAEAIRNGGRFKSLTKDLTEDEANVIKDEMIEQADDNVEEKGIRKAVKNASEFLKGLATAEAYGEEQRSKAASCYGEMKAVGEEAPPVDDAVPQDEGMQTKAIQELKANSLAKAEKVLELTKSLQALERLLV